MTKQFLILLFSLFVLISCKGGNNVVASRATHISTQPPTVITGLTLTPTQSSTPTVSTEVMHYQCLEITNDLPVGASLRGVIAYNGDNNLYAFLSNQETFDTYLLPREEGDTLWQFGVSPDGKYLKYIHSSVRTSDDQLVITTPDGQPIWSQVTDSINWEWFDHERLVDLEFLDDGTHTLSLFNPFSEEQQELQADFPDSTMFSPEWYGHWYYMRRGSPIYDPTLTRVLFPATANENKEEWPISIWNTETNLEVSRIITKDYWGAIPLWTPDGQQFIIATKMDSDVTGPPPNEFFAISRDGVVKQLTRFTNGFTEVNITDNYSLSPNGKLLAFWITAKPSPFQNPQLAVLNIETNEVTNYCIKGDPFADNAAEPAPPIWSPDSTQLLVISRIPEDTKVRLVVVADIENNYAVQINQDVEPVGWMVVP